MTTVCDMRRKVGSRVHTGARLVTSVPNCRRFFGSLWKTTMVNGIVTNVETVNLNNRNRSVITCWFDLPGQTKQCTLHLCNVKEGDYFDDREKQTERLGDSTGICNEDNTADDPSNSDSIVTESNASVPLQNVNVTDVQVAGDESVDVHGRKWIISDVSTPLNGFVQLHQWKVIGPAGDFITARHAPNNLTPLDCFMWIFPNTYLKVIVDRTIGTLCRKDSSRTTGGESLKFFGILVLMTRLEFSDRRDLWSQKSQYRYLSSPDLEKIMARNRFETIRSCIVFSGDGKRDEGGVARWNLVTDFVKAINDHRRTLVTPSHSLCVDESMSRWYGLGGEWVDVGLPHYTAVDRKPENGCEIKSVCCGESGIMMRIELSMGSEKNSQSSFSENHPHGTAVLLRLVEPWFGTERVVCADSFFASVQTATSLLEKGLRFIGVVKTATREFPMKHLSELTLAQRGEHVTLLSKGNSVNTNLMAVLWVDRDRRYFISTYGTTNPATPILRERWRKVNNITKIVEIETPIPEVCKEYYECCSMIDRHNRCRQDELKLEKKIELRNSLSGLIARFWQCAWLTRGIYTSQLKKDDVTSIQIHSIQNWQMN